MKTARQFILINALLLAGGLSAAEPAAKPAPAEPQPAKSDLQAAGEALQRLAQPAAQLATVSGVPTPMEEYGLSIGDVTVTRVRNPLGQLAANKHLLLGRQLEQITNPWEELAPGTAIVVDGRKAVILQIEPAEAPKDTGTANLRVTIRAKEIGGPEMSLTWQQELQTLNHRVEAEERRTIVGRIERELRVGSQVIVEGNRALITKLSLTDQAGAAREDDPPYTLVIDYTGISSPPGQITGLENRAEARAEPAWHFKHQATRGANPGAPRSMTDGSVRMVTWSFVNRTVDGHADPEGISPRVVVLHRRRGLVTRVEAPIKINYPNLPRVEEASVEAQFPFDGHVLTRTFHWKLNYNNQGQGEWKLQPHRSESFVEIYAVNDPNIRFQVTPRSLLEANERAMATRRDLRNPNLALPRNGLVRDASQPVFGFSAFTTNSVATQLKNLDDIFKSDASLVIKRDAKRQAVILMAHSYESRAIHYKALAAEHRLLADLEKREARRLEREAWANKRKADFLRPQFQPGELKSLEQGADISGPKDLETDLGSIGAVDQDVAEYIQSAAGKTPSDKAQDYTQFFRQAAAQSKAAAKLRESAQKLLEAAGPADAQATKFYMYALKMWREYILRTEGLRNDAQSLVDRGLEASPLPPDPYIPEILLRRGWIFRELGQTEEAVQSYYDVFTSHLKQRVNNLVRFERINLVAQSQIANALYEAPHTLKDRMDAIDKLKDLLQPDENSEEPEELDTEQIRLRHMRALYQTIREIDRRLAYGNRRLQALKSSKLDVASFRQERDKLTAQLDDLAKKRNRYWRQLAEHATGFIENYDKGKSVRYDGEVRYYKILAHQALGNEQHVQREVEVLLQNSSVTSELETVWAGTRLQIVMDIANLYYAEAIQKQRDLDRLDQQSPLSAGLVQTGNRDSSNNPAEPLSPTPPVNHALQVSVQQYLTTAITLYQWAQSHDQSYRSQILLRQQLAFAHERLSQKEKALDYYNQIIQLMELHPVDLNPTLTLVKHVTLFRQNNLRIEIEQAKQSK